MVVNKLTLQWFCPGSMSSQLYGHFEGIGFNSPTESNFAVTCSHLSSKSQGGGGGSARRIAVKLEKQKNDNFSSITFTTVFEICLYGRHSDSSVYPCEIF